jgi:hypothetical protein
MIVELQVIEKVIAMLAVRLGAKQLQRKIAIQNAIATEAIKLGARKLIERKKNK